MRFALYIGSCPAAQIVAVAQAAEAAGWDAIAVPDGLFWHEHVSVPYPYSGSGERSWDARTPFLDPFIAITAMASATRTLRFYPSVLKLAVRDPLLVAKDVSSCAVLTGERLGLGVGLSPWPEDFEVLRQDWSNRGPRSAEMIQIIRGLLGGAMYHFEGRYYQVPPLQIAPVPELPVPIYVGGLVEPVLRRAARLADGYIGWENPRCTLDEVPALVRRIAVYREEYGRAETPFDYKFMPRRFDADSVAQLADAGVDEVICAPWRDAGAAAVSLEQRLDAVRRCAGVAHGG